MDKFIKGELIWIKTIDPEEFEGKRNWSVIVYPDKESLDVVREMQADGIKNKVKKDEKGWFVKFSRPTQRVNKEGKVIRVFSPPVVTDESGNVIDGLIANGAIGTVRVDLYEHKVKGGTSHAARLEGIKLHDYKPYGEASTSTKEVKQESYF
jgi:hypothetical protein